MSNGYKAEIKKLPKSEVEIKGEIETSLLSSARSRALKNFPEKLDLPGFRKGHIPERVIIERVGEGRLLEDAAEMLINEFFPKIIAENNLDVIGRPKVSITKLALGNPLSFVVTVAVMPQFTLPDYKTVAKSALSSVKEDETEASDKEIDDVLAEIEKNKIKHNLSSAEELRSRVKENIIADKKLRNLEKRRAAIMEALVKDTPIEIPDVIVESEIEKSFSQFKDQIENSGMKLDEYLSQIKKTGDEVKKEMCDGSEKRAKIQLIFNEIARVEKIEPNKEILEHEVKHLLEHYPNANKESARIYVATQLVNQEVLKLLEKG